MTVLRALSGGDQDGGVSAFGAAGVGSGADVLAELERVRANLAALAEVVEDLRAKLNAHSHDGAVASLPAGERSEVTFTLA